MHAKRGTLGHSILWWCWRGSNMVKIGWKSIWNFTFQLLQLGVTVGWTSIVYNTSTLARTCPIVGLTLFTWLSCCWWAIEYFHFRNSFFKIFPHFHQSSNEQTNDTITHCITHSIHTHSIIVIHSFILLNELRMCGWVNFPLAPYPFFSYNYVGNRALGLHFLLSHTFALYHLALS
jgi:hypothetical protein